jgi:hypothetical protein
MRNTLLTMRNTLLTVGNTCDDEQYPIGNGVLPIVASVAHRQ